MTDQTMWILLIGALLGLATRIAKRWNLPKGPLPLLVLVAGFVVWAGRLVFIEHVPLADVPDVLWMGLGPGVVAIGGHSVIKRSLLAIGIPREYVTWILGRLPDKADLLPSEKPPK